MPSSAPTGRDSEKFNLRLPDGMRNRIADAAKANGRSMNSEIVHRLMISLEAERLAPPPPVEDRPTLDQVMAYLDKARDALALAAEEASNA